MTIGHGYRVLSCFGEAAGRPGPGEGRSVRPRQCFLKGDERDEDTIAGAGFGEESKT